MKTFLHDAWYCAGFNDDLAAGALRPITMLGKPLVLFRLGSGELAALAGRCPHRFAPLSKGCVAAGDVQCPYHGPRFDGEGRCTHNPHGDGAIPKAARVSAYPALERHGALWVWMGEAAQADPALLTDFEAVEQREGWSRVQGYLHVQANCQLVSDNLMDLSHVPFLHPFLSGSEPPPPDLDPDVRMEQQGDRVVAINQFRKMPNTPLYQMLWERGAPPAFISMRANMRWDPPSMMLLDTGGCPVDARRENETSCIPIVAATIAGRAVYPGWLRRSSSARCHAKPAHRTTPHARASSAA